MTKTHMKTTKTQPTSISRPVSMSLEEIRYIEDLLREPLNYYRMMAGSSKCSEFNRNRHQLLDGLSQKLREAAK